MLLNSNICAQVGDELSSDIVIIGAGTIGLFIADCLLKINPLCNILMVESGNEIATRKSNLKDCTIISKFHYGVELGRASGIGGTSTLWGGQLAELDPKDIRREDKPWPIDYDELAQLYAEVYAHFGMDILSQDNYRKALGGEITVAKSIQRFFTHWLPEPNFSKLFKRTILSRNIRLVTNLTANNIQFDKSTATSISAISENGRAVKIKSKKFIFACGTIPLNRFFLTTQRHGQNPWASNENVGTYFQDHLGGEIGTVKILDEKKFRQYFESGIINRIKVQPKLKLNDKFKKIANVSVSFVYESNLKENYHNLKRVFKNINASLGFSSIKTIVTDLIKLGNLIFPVVLRYLKDRRVFVFFENGVKLNVQSEQIPFRASRIVISKNVLLSDGLFPVALDWNLDGREIDSIYETALEVDKYLRHEKIAEIKLNPDLIERKPQFLDSLCDIYHQCGGLLMSNSANDGVVDKDCLVWGSDNVWIAGAAVFPSSGHANSTLTALALSYKISNIVGGKCNI